MASISAPQTSAATSTAMVQTNLYPITAFANSAEARAARNFDGESGQGIYLAARAQGMSEDVAELFKRQRILAIQMDQAKDAALSLQTSMHRLKQGLGRLFHVANIRRICARVEPPITTDSVMDDIRAARLSAADAAFSLRDYDIARHQLLDSAESHANAGLMTQSDYQAIYARHGDAAHAPLADVEDVERQVRKLFTESWEDYKTNHQELLFKLDMAKLDSDTSTWASNNYASYPAGSPLNLLLRVMPHGHTFDSDYKVGYAAEGYIDSNGAVVPTTECKEPTHWLSGRLDSESDAADGLDLIKALNHPDTAPQYFKDALVEIDGVPWSGASTSQQPPQRLGDEPPSTAQDAQAGIAKMNEIDDGDTHMTW